MEERDTDFRISVDKEGEQVVQSMPLRDLCAIVRLRQLLLHDEAESRHLKESKTSIGKVKK